MSTYFKILNLDKKQRGMLATHITNEQAQELIAQKYDAGFTKNPYIGFDKETIKGSWAKEHRGYLGYYNKEEAGAIFMEACGNLWGQLWEESDDWPEKYFHIDYADLSWNAKDYIDEINKKAKERNNNETT